MTVDKTLKRQMAMLNEINSVGVSSGVDNLRADPGPLKSMGILQLTSVGAELSPCRDKSAQKHMISTYRWYWIHNSMWECESPMLCPFVFQWNGTFLLTWKEKQMKCGVQSIYQMNLSRLSEIVIAPYSEAVYKALKLCSNLVTDTWAGRFCFFLNQSLKTNL